MAERCRCSAGAGDALRPLLFAAGEAPAVVPMAQAEIAIVLSAST